MIFVDTNGRKSIFFTPDLKMLQFINFREPKKIEDLFSLIKRYLMDIFKRYISKKNSHSFEVALGTKTKCRAQNSAREKTYSFRI